MNPSGAIASSLPGSSASSVRRRPARSRLNMLAHQRWSSCDAIALTAHTGFAAKLELPDSGSTSFEWAAAKADIAIDFVAPIIGRRTQ